MAGEYLDPAREKGAEDTMEILRFMTQLRLLIQIFPSRVSDEFVYAWIWISCIVNYIEIEI